MRVAIPQPAGFAERSNIYSGRISRENHPDYGVIFSSSKESSQSDFDLNTILNASLISKITPDTKFKILGGYYFQDGEKPRTSKVFGKAGEPEFGIVEGGNLSVTDHWQLKLNPGRRFDEKGAGDGWTFIVDARDENDYPHSTNPLEIFIECPEIHRLSVNMGACQLDPSDGQAKQKVTFFICVYDEVPAEKWTFDFGDGQITSGDGPPPNMIEHLYFEQPKNPPRLSLQCAHQCGEVVKEVGLSDLNIIAPPAIINEIKVSYGDCKTIEGKRKRQTTFSVSINGESEKWIWDFGDGFSTYGEGRPPESIKHFYENLPQKSPKLILQLPNPYQETSKEVELANFVVCNPCPQILDIKQATKDKNASSITYEFSLEMEGQADEYNWYWEDTSKSETTKSPVTEHTFRLNDRLQQHKLTVKAQGPDDCLDSYEKTISIPAIGKPGIFSFYNFMPVIVSFFIAITFGLYLGQIVAELCLQDTDLGGLPTYSITFVLLSITAIVAWFLLGKKNTVQPPGLSNWITTLWVTLLAGTQVTFYLRGCCESSWWLIILLLFSSAALAFLFWYKKWQNNIDSLEILTNLIVALLSGIIVNYVFLVDLVRKCVLKDF